MAIAEDGFLCRNEKETMDGFSQWLLKEEFDAVGEANRDE